MTIIQFNDKPAHAEMMTSLIEEISQHLPNSSYHVSSELKKKPQDVSKTAVAYSIMGTPSENSSAGSTLSGTIPGMQLLFCSIRLHINININNNNKL